MKDNLTMHNTLSPIGHIYWKVLLCMISSCFFYWDLSAQEACPMDSLQKLLTHSAQDTQRVLVLNELAWCLAENHAFAPSLAYGQEAAQLAKRLAYKAGESTSYIRIGTALSSLGKFQEATQSFYLSLALEDSLHNAYGIARAQNWLGSTYRKVAQLDSAIYYLSLAKIGFEKLNYVAFAANINMEIGNAYTKKGNKEKAIRYLLEALSTYQNTQNAHQEAQTLLSLGNLEYYSKNAPQATFYYQQALQIFLKLKAGQDIAFTYKNLGSVKALEEEYGSSNQLLYKSLALHDSLAMNETIEEVILAIGRNLIRLEKYDEAKDKIKQSIKLALGQKDQSSLVNAYLLSAEILEHENQIDSAFHYYDQALAISEEAKLSNLERGVLEKYFKFCARQGQIKRFDSLYNMYNQISADLQSDYQSAVNYRLQYQEEKRKNDLLAQEQLVLQAQNQRQLTFIIALILGLVLLTALSYFIYRNYNNHRKAVQAEKLVALKEKEINTLFQEVNIKSTNAMLQGQEEERKRIAKDLHDRLGGLLSMVKLNFEAVDRQIDEIKLRNVEMYQQAVSLLDNACEEVRNVAHNMESGILRNFGLIAAIEEMVETIKTSELIDIHLTEVGFDDKRLPILMEIELNRIIQELVSNVIRHAEATQIDIQLFWKTDLINIIVEDNGKGFNLDVVKAHAGMGLRNLEQRVEALHGELIFDSHPGRGTTALINIPFNDNN